MIEIHTTSENGAKLAQALESVRYTRNKGSKRGTIHEEDLFLRSPHIEILEKIFSTYNAQQKKEFIQGFEQFWLELHGSAQKFRRKKIYSYLRDYVNKLRKLKPYHPLRTIELKTIPEKPWKNGTLRVYNTTHGKLVIFPEETRTPQELIRIINEHGTQLYPIPNQIRRVEQLRNYTELEPQTAVVEDIVNRTIMIPEQQIILRRTGNKLLDNAKSNELTEEARILSVIKQHFKDNEKITAETPLALHLSPYKHKQFLITRLIEGEEHAPFSWENDRIDDELEKTGVTAADLQYIKDKNGKKHIIDTELFKLERKKPRKNK